MRLTVLIVMSIIYLAIGIAGGALLFDRGIRSLAQARLDGRLHRGGSPVDAYIPRGRTSQAMGWYGAGLFVIGISVALGPFDNGGAFFIGLPFFMIICIASMFVGFFATARA